MADTFVTPAFEVVSEQTREGAMMIWNLSFPRRIMRLPVIGELYRRGLLFPVILVVAVIGVLAHGAWTRNTPTGPDTESQPLQIPVTVPSLRPDLEKTPLTYISDYWQQLGEQVRNRFLLVGSGGHPSVVVAPGVALTTLAAADDVAAGQQVIEAQGVRAPEEVLGVDTDLNLALIAVKQDDPTASFSLVFVPELEPGSFIAEIGLRRDGNIRIIPSNVVSWDPDSEPHLEVTPELAAREAVVALVDLDGELVGVAVPDADGIHVLAHDELSELVERLTSGATCQAIDVADLSDEIRGLLGITAGVAIERIHEDAFLPEPSLRGGDILLEWNGTEVMDGDGFASLYEETEPGTLVPYVVFRGRRRVSGRTRMPQTDCRPVSSTRTGLPGLGMTLDQTDDGRWQVISLPETGVAARSGVEEGDLILAVDGVPLGEDDRETLLRLDEAATTPVVTIQRGVRTLLRALDQEST